LDGFCFRINPISAAESLSKTADSVEQISQWELTPDLCHVHRQIFVAPNWDKFSRDRGGFVKGKVIEDRSELQTCVRGSSDADVAAALRLMAANEMSPYLHKTKDIYPNIYTDILQ
jgi:hypothetical protein